MSKHLVFAAALCALVSAQGDVPQCGVVGECQGQLIGVQTSDSVEDCLSSCKDTQGCLYYTYEAVDGICSLLSSCPIINPEGCPTCISGEVTCPLITCNEPGVCLGTLLHQEGSQSLLECETACSEYEGCRYYSYSNSNTICFLFATCPEINESDGLEDAVTGQPGCATTEPSEDKHWLLVAGGYAQFGEPSDYVNLVSLDPINHPVPDCLRDPSPLPLDIAAAAGGRNESGYPMLCGGFEVGFCLVYDPIWDEWTLAGVLPDFRYYIGNVATDNYGLIMTGGYYNGQSRASTLITKNGNDFDTDSVPDLPDGTYYNCLVAVDELEMLVSIGGGGSASSATYIYTKGDSEWIRLNNTLYERYGAGCGLVRRPSGEKYIVVAGGNIVGAVITSDILDLATMAWREGPPLPHEHCYMASVQYGDTFALVGGTCSANGDKIYLYDVAAEDWALLEEERISPGRHDVNAILVSQDLFPDCSD